MTFTTCLNCMDGRAHLPTINWIKAHCSCEYVDMITEPGIAELIAAEDTGLEPIIKKINISLEKHGSKEIFIVGHHDCAGCCHSEEDQIKDIEIAVKKLKNLYPGLQVTGLWVNENWEVEKIYKICDLEETC